MAHVAYCPNCGIDLLTNPEPEKPCELEPISPGLVELRGYCGCGVYSIWSCLNDQPPVLRLAFGNDYQGKPFLEVPPKARPFDPALQLGVDFGNARDQTVLRFLNMPIRLDPRASNKIFLMNTVA